MSRKKARGSESASGADRDNAYEVGYRKPPLHSRWQPGQSGNGRGRPKGSLNLQTIAAMLADELAELVSVKGTDGNRKVTKQQAFFKKLINDALTGGARDKKLLFDAMLRLTAVQAAAEDDATGEGVPGGADALQRCIERELRRRTLGDKAPEDNEDEDDGEASL